MPRPKHQKDPAYCLHKSSGRAFVKLSDKRIYLGRHGSPESRDRYSIELGEWKARGRQLKPVAPITGESTPMSVAVSEVIDGFWSHAQVFFRDRDGKPTAQLTHFKLVLRLLNKLYGNTPAVDFGPLALMVVRSEMLKPKTVEHPGTKRERTFPGWSRNYANAQVKRLKLVFKWAVEHELLKDQYGRADFAVYERLKVVESLQEGKSEARETHRVTTVDQSHVDAVKPFVSRQVQAMIQLQELTGARPGEICAMRTCDIDTTGAVWMYRPPKHKTAHRKRIRHIAIGPEARKVVEPFLRPNLTEFLFSPREAEAERRAAATASRGTPPGHGNCVGTNRRRSPKRTPGERYDVNSYRKAIARGCDKANLWAKGGRVCGNDETLVISWHPHQIRHNAATRIERQFGPEAARIVLGHSSPGVTETYIDRDGSKAAEYMSRIG